MSNTEIDIDKKDDYIDWLENVCLSFLTNNRIVSKEGILKKLEKKEINIENCFVTHLLKIQDNKQKENMMIQKLPLLKSYPIDLNSDIYDEDVEPIYKWELKTVQTLLLKLDKQYEGKIITPEAYHNFFAKEIKPYKIYFFNDMDADGMIYEKILPQNVSKYWSYRLNKNISWGESWEQKNVGISVISIIENEYLSKDKRMAEFEYVIG